MSRSLQRCFIIELRNPYSTLFRIKLFSISLCCLQMCGFRVSIVSVFCTAKPEPEPEPKQASQINVTAKSSTGATIFTQFVSTTRKCHIARNVTNLICSNVFRQMISLCCTQSISCSMCVSLSCVKKNLNNSKHVLDVSIQLAKYKRCLRSQIVFEINIWKGTNSSFNGMPDGRKFKGA